ncbi:post-transcriptional regulator [Bacillus sonorensis]|uniref:Post-transcriptional regulator ComN n=2 Tax=Bacillus sonorensis TaxID=119858 RepID=M5P6P7_9BACI|nr:MULTISPECIES: post-transcriptional regulator [Bacillus]TWK79014.1 Post-transcriptional regulator ComN [Bacillus paralicheniformis]ASB88108.1 Post-transcriptional regulator ComN [Bacillus sonorensis]EME75128.1 post-transcriptional regulator ComN [Bacillus sonorensis L12]MBG9915983.1 competence protein ComN [Bacillus sonorensis]MCF7617508.1 post-transcriptional regulator [Bacillus sonorensis]
MDKHPADMYKDHLKPFLKSKLEEFMILGYDDIEIEELWSYLLNKKWKNRKNVQIHQLAADILSVKIGEFMNYATVESFKTSNLLDSKEGQDMLDELLK